MNSDEIKTYIIFGIFGAGVLGVGGTNLYFVLKKRLLAKKLNSDFENLIQNHLVEDIVKLSNLEKKVEMHKIMLENFSYESATSYNCGSDYSNYEDRLRYLKVKYSQNSPHVGKFFKNSYLLTPSILKLYNSLVLIIDKKIVEVSYKSGRHEELFTEEMFKE